MDGGSRRNGKCLLKQAALRTSSSKRVYLLQTATVPLRWGHRGWRRHGVDQHEPDVAEPGCQDQEAEGSLHPCSNSRDVTHPTRQQEQRT